MKYLTNSGLSYFLNKIKAYLTSSTYLNSIGISNSEIDDIADDAGYSSGSLPASEDVFLTGDIIPNTDNSVDLGASSKNIKMIYTKGITINGTQFLPSDYVPRSGGAVLTGTTIARTDNTSSITFCGGTDANNGGSIGLYGKDRESSTSGGVFITANDGAHFNTFHLRSNGDTNLTNCEVFYSTRDNFTRLGHPAYRWTEVCAVTGTINASDSRLKNTITDIDDNLLDAWETIQPKQYKFNDATEKKGEKARYHTGYLAQDIQAECEKHGINASDYGLFCYDEWEEQEEVSEEVETEKDGKIVKEKRVIQPKREKGNMYALRYEEALVVECAYLRKRIKELEERLEKLEAK